MFRLWGHGSPAAILAAVLTACGPSSNAPPASPAASSTDEVPVTGRERIAWTQAVRATDDVHFAVYVDERTRVELRAACTVGGTDTRHCESPLPALPPGRHSLELVAWFRTAQGPNESARSPAVIVRVSPSAANASSAPDGRPARGPVISADCGLVVTSNNDLVMWDSSGTIRAIDPASRQSRVWSSTDREHDNALWVLSGLAVHPAFAKNGWIYLAEMSRDEKPILRVARYRRNADVLGDRTILFEQALTTRPFRVKLSAARDRLDVALLAAPSLEAAETPAPRRFLLRLKLDGPMPAGADAFAAEPVATRPVDVVWPADGGRPWVIEQTSRTRYTLTAGRGSARPSSFTAASPPVAARLAVSGGQTTLWITLGQGDLLRFHESVVGWVLSPQDPDSTPGRPARDAVLSGAEEMAFCGPDEGPPTSDPAAPAVWRRRLRN